MKRLITTLCLLLVLSGRAFAAIAIDATSSANGGSGATSPLSWSHTCTGSDRFLLVGVAVNTGGGTTVSGVTYSGVALTQIATLHNTTIRVDMWRLIAPATGANTVSVTLSTATQVSAGALSLTGVHQTTPLGTHATNSGATNAPTVTVTSASGELVVDALAAITEATLPITVDASQVERWANKTTNNDAQTTITRGSTEAGASSVVMSWSKADTANWASIGVPVKPAIVKLPDSIFEEDE